jgi:Domain of unknown function (DUF397)
MLKGMEDERKLIPGASEVFGTAGSAPGEPVPGDPEAGTLPVMPGFREMALRRRADEQAARMAEDRGRLVRELAGQRQAAGLSQTVEVGTRAQAGRVLVRDTKDRQGPVLRFTPGAWRRFADRVRPGGLFIRAA